MKRELKGITRQMAKTSINHIARPIPMKRELKDIWKCSNINAIVTHCKAHPDEKGTESFCQSQLC